MSEEEVVVRLVETQSITGTNPSKNYRRTLKYNIKQTWKTAQPGLSRLYHQGMANTLLTAVSIKY